MSDTASLRAGPLSGQDLSLLVAGKSVLNDRQWGLMVFDRYDDSERRAFLTGLSDGQVRLLVPSKMLYVGERDDKGWIHAPEGGWSENPVPGQTVQWRSRAFAGTGEADRMSWARDVLMPIIAFRLSDPASVGDLGSRSASPSIPTEQADGAVFTFAFVSALAEQLIRDRDGPRGWAAMNEEHRCYWINRTQNAIQEARLKASQVSE